MKELSLLSLGAAFALQHLQFVVGNEDAGGGAWSFLTYSPEIGADDGNLSSGSSWLEVMNRTGFRTYANQRHQVSIAGVASPWSFLTSSARVRSTLMRRSGSLSAENLDDPWPRISAMLEVDKVLAATRHSEPTYDPTYNISKGISGMEVNLMPKVPPAAFIGKECVPDDQGWVTQGCWLTMSCYKYSDVDSVAVCKNLCNSDPHCKGFNQVRNSTYQMQGTCCFASGVNATDTPIANPYATWWAKNCTTITVGTDITSPTLAGYKLCEQPHEGDPNNEASFWLNQDRAYLSQSVNSTFYNSLKQSEKQDDQD
eukprot:gnl/MRDRNA2_/MRDRNA2_130658_c0_seq1.p1 gnl/MRDRNA2_/MRDRNA2_130658_c0~~gnl/MRDRNA2_/MRDRNA2_130658_c0_seq1.p1  ORF type:complete len:313 (-),score=34.98 gnl/MRDRNA2_/MRDRNA2_130658_c0_seq1:19-957(-)